MTISIYDDIIDSLDVIERIEELEAMRDDPDAGLNTDDDYELSVWAEVRDEFAECIPDWGYNTLIINSSHFEDYMDETIADCYELPKDLPTWMIITYDYEALRTDYTEATVSGQTLLIRK